MSGRSVQVAMVGSGSPSSGGQRLGNQGFVTPAMAVLSAIVMLAVLLAPADRSSLVEAGDSVLDRMKAIGAPEEPLARNALEAAQTGEVAQGLTLAPMSGATPSVDGRFMVAGPVFTTADAAQFTVVTSTIGGATVAAVEPRLDGDRVLYERGDVTEWWVRNGSAYEQGWTVAAPLATGDTIVLGVEFAGAAPLVESPTSVQLILDDGSRVWYRDLHAFDADGIVLPAVMSVDGSTVLIEVDAAGAAYPVTIDPIIDADQKLDPPPSSDGDMTGSAVAASGNRMAVAAPGNDENTGAVITYERADGESDWTLDEVLVDPDPSPFEGPFGSSLDLEGDFLVVGVVGEEGRAVVYEHDGSDWVLRADVGGPLEGEEPVINSRFGTDVAISADGDWLAVGAPGSVVECAACGAVRIYEWDTVSSAYVTSDIISDDTVGVQDFGQSVDLDEIPGAPGENRIVVGLTSTADKVQSWLFESTEGFWFLESGIDTAFEIGQSVALDGDRLVAASSIGVNDALFVADIAGTGEPWVERQLFDEALAIDAGGLLPNSIVDVDGDVIAVGLDGDPGSVGIFYNDPTFGWGAPSVDEGWEPGPVDTLEPGGGAAGDNVGRSVAVDGTTIVTGAPGDDTSGTDAGAAYSLNWTPPTPTPVANKITGDGFNSDRMGRNISIDGEFAAVAAPGVGPGGKVYILAFAEGAWDKIQTIEQDSSVTEFGIDVYLEGDRLAVVSDADVYLYTRASAAGPFVEGPSINADFAGITSVVMQWPSVFVGIAGSNHVQHFFDEGESFSEIAVSLPTDLEAGDGFGASMDIFDQHLAVGAPGWDSTGSDNAGKVYIYSASADSFVDEIVEPGGPTGDAFGRSVALDDGLLVVGQTGASGPVFGGPATAPTGLVYVFEATEVEEAFTGYALQQTLSSVQNDTGGSFGFSVDIDLDVIVVGSSGAEALGVNFRHGAAYSFVNDGSEFVEVDYFLADDKASGDQLGYAVAVDGQNALVGARQDDNPVGEDAGAAYYYTVGAPPVEPDDPTLDFALDLGPGSPASIQVAPSGVSVTDFNTELLESVAEDDTSLAAAGFSETDIADSPLSSLPLSSLPLSSLAADPNSTIGPIPLIEIDIEDGWQALFERAGSALGEVPLVDLTLADVVADPAANAEFNAIELGEINLRGTPLSSLPLSSLVLGNTPLSSLANDADWCGILGPFIPGICTAAKPLSDVTLMEASLSGVPLSSLPLSSLPLSSLPLSSLPLSSLPLSSLDLAESPLSSLPLSSLPLSSLELDGIPLSSLPLSSLPLSSLVVDGTAVEDAPLSSLPLSSLELSNVPLSSLPLSSLPLSSLPLSSLPLSSLVLADTPLSSLPLSSLDPNLPDWCDYLASLDIGYDCSYAADEASFLANTTIADLGVQGVPLSSLPLSSLPLSSLTANGATLVGLPLSSLPLSSLPLSSLPLSSLPLSSLDLTGTPLSSLGANLASVPLSSLDVVGSPLSSLPLSSLDLTGTPLSSLPLSSLPLSSLPMSSLPLSSLDVNGSPLSSLPLSSLDTLSTPLSSLPLSSLPLSSLGVDCALVDCEIDSLGDALIAGAVDPTEITLGELQEFLSGIRLADIAQHIDGATLQQVLDAVAALPSTDNLGSVPTLDDLVLGDLPVSLIEVQNTVLGDLESALWAVRLGDLLGDTLIDPNTGQPFANSDVITALQSALGASTVADIENLGDATVGDLLAGDDGTFTFGDLGPILGLIHVVDVVPNLAAEGGNLGGLTDEELGDLTLLDLIGLGEASFDNLTLGQLLEAANTAGELFGFDVADLLLALIGVEIVPFSDLDFTEVETGQLPGDIVPPVTFAATFTIADTTADKTVRITTQIPSTSTYTPGSGLLEYESDGVVSEPAEPVVDGNTLEWTLTGIMPDFDYTLTFSVTPTVSIGSSTLSSTATIVGTDVNAVSFTSVEVVEGLEPNDFRPADVTAASENFVYLTYISSATDNDVFSITVQENDQLAIQLSSLTVDLDFALYGTPADTTVNTPLTDVSEEAPLDPITDPDQAGAVTEPLDDFRRLDDENGTLEFIGISNAAGTETELLVTDALPAGTYYVQVFGANGATNVEPAALQLQILEADDRPDCAVQGAVTGTTGTAPQLGNSTANTLILVNEQRMRAFYGDAQWEDLETELDAFVTYLDDEVATLGIEPIVVPVDGFGAVQQAYSAWDTNASCSPESANAVVSAIIDNVVDPLRDNLDHIMVIGSDQVIPMARLLDVTSVANEYDYRHEFIGDNIVGANATDINAFSASFWDRQYLSDEPYGESSARDLGNRFLYVSDIALGRMVETPDEIEAALQHFQTFEGALDASTAAVLGYDFLVDSSEQIADDLRDANYAVDDDLADGFVGEPAGGVKWDKDDAEAKVVPAGGAPDLISLNGHFDHYRALPADGDKVPNFDDNFLAETVAGATPGILAGSIVFSMGCHGGLSVSDLQIGNTNGDWAQTFAADQAIFIGNTGFGYGDTEAVAYTERLMAQFAERAVRPIEGPGGSATTTIGQAFTFAKNDYASDLSVFSVYDEKALMEATFYGIPFYRVGAPAVAPEPVPSNVTAPDSTGLETLTISTNPVNNRNTTDRGVIFSNPDENGDPQVIVAPGKPIQPSQSFDVSVVTEPDTTTLDKDARGALVLQMTSTYESPPEGPVIAATVFNESVQSPEPPVGDVVFPAKPLTLNTSTTPGGERQDVVLATGQFNSTGSVQRLDTQVTFVVYYGPPGSTDFTAPTIGAVSSTLVDDVLTVTLSATDDVGTVERVYLLAAPNPGSGTVTWLGLDLDPTAGTDEWSGSVAVPAGTNNVKFIVQAVDSSGNVGFATNKARNFDEDEVVVVNPPTPGLTVTPSTENFDPGTGWYTGPVEVTVETASLPATYKIGTGPSTPVPASGVFTITGDGTKMFKVTAANGQMQTGTVRIDTKLPTASVAPPADGATFEQGAVPAVSFLCQDPSLQTCSATADGNTIGIGQPLPSTPGPHSVTVVATDVFGNTASAGASYTVVAAPVDGPEVTAAVVDNVALSGQTVNVYAEFSGGEGPYTVSIDWGEGSTCPGDGSCSLEDPVGDDPGVIEGSFDYQVSGPFDIVVTVTDVNGDSGSAIITTPICTITGTSRNDRINGTSGDDVICGLDGNDRINGRGGNDVIYAGAGNDRVNGGSGDDTIFGSDKNDQLNGGGGADFIDGGDGNDGIDGRSGPDTLRGGNGNDAIDGGAGDDQLFGDAGNDELDGGSGTDDCDGGPGNDDLSNCETTQQVLATSRAWKGPETNNA